MFGNRIGCPYGRRFVPRRRQPVSARGAVMLIGLTLLGATANAQSHRSLARADLFLQQIAASRTEGSCDVIIRVDGGLNREQLGRLRSLSVVTYRDLPIIHSIAAQVPVRNLAAVADLPFVTRLSADAVVRKTDEFTVGHTGADVAFQQYSATGYGVAVAVVDSGIHANADLNDPATGKSRVVASVNFVPNTTSVDDGCGHGSHVAGIIAGNGHNSSGSAYFHTFYGIARRVNLVNVRVLDATGGSTVSTVVSALQWVVNNKSKYNIRVINLSMGHSVGESYATDPLCQVCESAWKAGIVVVCAAGNNGREYAVAVPGLADNGGYGTAYGSVTSPGNDPYVITVGAMKQTDGVRAHDAVATYSGRGPTRLDFLLKPDIVAPGNQVISLRTAGSVLDVEDGLTNDEPLSAYCYNPPLLGQPQYFKLSGTSMATPVVAGAAALLVAANSSLTPDTVKTRLMLSADKWAYPSGLGDACTFGAGYLNIPAALSCTLAAQQYAISPSLTEDSSGNVFINQNNALWGSGSLWGTGVTSLNAIWGTNALWGSNTLSSSNAIWGTSIWSSNAMWGTSAFSIDLGPIVINGE